MTKEEFMNRCRDLGIDGCEAPLTIPGGVDFEPAVPGYIEFPGGKPEYFLYDKNGILDAEGRYHFSTCRGGLFCNGLCRVCAKNRAVRLHGVEEVLASERPDYLWPVELAAAKHLGIVPSKNSGKMSKKQYQFCIRELPNYTDADAYVSDLALSDIWCDGPEDGIPENRIRHLREIYQAAAMMVTEIAKAAGLNITQMAARFAVPYRTMQDWFSGARTCSLSIRLMMLECLGLYRPPID